MLSKEDNELLCRVGPGTPMGDFFRQYWLPALPSRDLPAPDCRPVRVRLLGENLVAFRDSEGRVGLLQEHCPHRGASLYWGRNEECGLRCVYHGWKFDVSGRCVDMPNEPAESTFKDKVRAKAYPCREVNHVIWTYMGPRATPPPFPPFEVNTLPAEQVAPPHMMLAECNWLQALEGEIDSSHIDWVHARLNPEIGDYFREKYPGAPPGTYNIDRRPRFEVLPTPYGGCYAAIRRWNKDENLLWARITQFIFPAFAMIALMAPNSVNMRIWLPLDDEHTLLFLSTARLDRPLTEEERRRQDDPFALLGGYLPKRGSDPFTRYLTVARKENDYNYDEELARRELMVGLPFIGNIQDRMMTESMGPIFDRSQEHLGTTDAMVIYVRRQLLRAVKALRERGEVPANVDDPSLNRVRAASVLFRPGENWIEVSEAARNADAGVPTAWVPLFDAR